MRGASAGPRSLPRPAKDSSAFHTGPAAFKRRSNSRLRLWRQSMTNSGKCGLRALGLLVLALAATCAAAQDDAMPPETEAPAEAAPKPAHSPGRPSQAQAAKPQQEQDPADPSAPSVNAAPAPHWPVNDQPTRAEVVWDSHGLTIDATNSSLQQILKDVSIATGATVEGLNGDERVFGAYGPGQARDVLSQLLQGAGYNVMMIGNQGQGAPRQILLTTRRSNDQSTQARGSANNNSDDDSSDADSADDQNVPMPPPRPGFPGGFPRNPQQRMQQFRQEREQLLNQQQQQQQQQPQNTNP
jgi:hypothetical protein